MSRSLEGWSLEKPLDFVVGETYVVRANHDDGFWASMLITIVGENVDSFEFELNALLDGSPGLVDGYDNALDNRRSWER